MHRERSVQVSKNASSDASLFGANTYSYMRSHSAEACVARLADQGFDEFEIMVHPGHLWPSDMSAEQRRALRRTIENGTLKLVSLNMPNIDINVAAAAQGMRFYSLNLLIETVRRPDAFRAALAHAASESSQGTEHELRRRKRRRDTGRDCRRSTRPWRRARRRA